MKIFAMLLVAPLAVFAGPSRAQAPGPGSLEKPIRDRLDSLRARNHASPERYDGGRDAQRGQLREVMARLRQDRVAARAQILALLSPDQRRIAGELFDEERRKAEADGPRRWGGGSERGPWDRP